VPYRLPEVLEAVRGCEPIYVVEGEKDADRLRNLGLTTTCNPGGAGNWRREYAPFFDGATAILLPDVVSKRHRRRAGQGKIAPAVMEPG